MCGCLAKLVEAMTDATESPTKRAVLELKKRDGNNVCADCGKKGE